MRAGVLDYGLGNLPSVTKALAKAGADAVLVTEPGGFDGVLDAVVVPGVGHFGAGARNLRDCGFVEPLREWAASGRPLLGICVGLQLFFERSEEDQDARGLGVVDGEVKRLRSAPKVPHMGWNTIEDRAGVAEALQSGDMTYFVHSYYVAPDAKAVAGTTEYGERFCSVLQQDNVWGFQFHPEKSAEAGQRLLRAFVAAS